MRFLIVGAGTIGLTYSWLLSFCHEVTVYIRPEKIAEYQQGYAFDIQDLRDKSDKQFNYIPKLTTNITQGYDAILIMVNRIQLADVLPLLHDCENIVFMLNHWDIESEVKHFLSPAQYLYGFPSQVGGGRESNQIKAVVFDEGTLLGEVNGETTARLTKLEQAFTQAGLSIEVKPDILNWMKVHYLQQSLSAGGIAKAGSYEDFAGSYWAIKEMVYAFREGMAVCEAQGINTKKIFPASMFRYPAFLVAWAMKGMFNKPETVTMVKGHMKQGMPEWITGFNEVLEDGLSAGLEMPIWKSYKPYVDSYLQ